jgi:hypothetical protein
MSARLIAIGLVVVFAPGTAHAEMPATRWTIEGSVGLKGSDDDAYTARLEQFGYEAGTDLLPDGHFVLAVAWRAHASFEVGAELSSLEERRYHRSADSVGTSYDWSSHAASLLLRAVTSSARVAAFLEAGPGVAWASTDLAKGRMAHARERHLGASLLVGFGLRLLVMRHAGLVLKLRHIRAPVLENNYGERHDVGGTAMDLGLCVTF